MENAEAVCLVPSVALYEPGPGVEDGSGLREPCADEGRPIEWAAAVYLVAHEGESARVRIEPAV